MIFFARGPDPTLRRMKIDDPATAVACHVLEADPDLRRLSAVLQEQEHRLKNAVSAEAFRLYLDIEATSNARLIILGARAWEAGRRSE
jgi:hypothetical protein